MNSKLLVIFGEMGSGKDTVGDILCSEYLNSIRCNIGDVTRNLAKIIEDYALWKDDCSYLKEAVKNIILKYISNVKLFCDTYKIDNPSLDASVLINKVSSLILDISLWKGGTRPLLHKLADAFRDIDKNFLNYCTVGHILSLESEYSLCLIVGGRTHEDFEFYKKLGFTIVGVTCSPETRECRLSSRDGVAQIHTSNHNTERYVSEIVKKADVVICNDGSLMDLTVQIKNIFGNLLCVSR